MRTPIARFMKKNGRQNEPRRDEVTMTFLRRNLAAVIEWTRTGTVVVTHRGRPIAVLSQARVWHTRAPNFRTKAIFSFGQFRLCVAKPPPGS